MMPRLEELQRRGRATREVRISYLELIRFAQEISCVSYGYIMTGISTRRDGCIALTSTRKEDGHAEGRLLKLGYEAAHTMSRELPTPHKVRVRVRDDGFPVQGKGDFGGGVEFVIRENPSIGISG